VKKLDAAGGTSLGGGGFGAGGQRQRAHEYYRV
jgi:hypothetical protein